MTTTPFWQRFSLTIDETGEAGGWGRTTTYKLIGEGRLKTVSIGKRRLVLVPSLLQLLDPKGEHWPIPDRPSTPEAAR
jgi:hypothetical protein